MGPRREQHAGNGWREEMICSIKAQALASGQFSEVVVANRSGPAEQGSDLRTLISRGVNAIVVNPSSPSALQQRDRTGCREEHQGRLGRPAGDRAAGLQRDERPGRVRPDRRRVAVPEARRPRQRRRDARHRRRARGHRPARGLPAGPEEVPEHQGRETQTFTGWQFAPGGKQMLDILNSGVQVDGVGRPGSTTRS